MNRIRSGTVLIVVSGLAALLAAMVFAFLARMRADAAETAGALAEAQARIMLVAACTYVIEAARIGWDDPNTAAHEECAGWIDVRDGAIGPKPQADTGDDDSRFPIGTWRRFPMQALRRPPFAVRQTVATNPIRTPWSPDPVAAGDALFGRPYLANPDPQPVVDNGWPTPSPARWADYAAGDRTPIAASAGRSWFRLYRDAAARFVVTCGAGGTLGYRSWTEVSNDGAEDRFGDDPALFGDLRAQERRLWWLIEWSGAIGAPDYHNLDNSFQTSIDNHQWMNLNTSHKVGVSDHRTQAHCRNLGGTIRWVQRLRDEPTRW